MKAWQKITSFLLIGMVLSACAAVLPMMGAGPRQVVPTKTAASAETATLAPSQTGTPTGAAEAPPTATPEPPQATAEPTEARKTLLDEYLPRHEVLAETDHFVFYAQDGYFPVDLERWKALSEEIYAYVADRLGADSPVKISVAFQPAQKEACPIRGLASSEDPPVIILFADPGTSETYLLAVLSHEVGHAIPGRGFEGGLPNDISLTEGLASWASGKYWDAWMGVPSIHHLVLRYLDAGTYLPLPENADLPQIYPWQEGAGEGCLARRDQIYSQWASFLDFLIRQYGWEKVYQLFESARTETVNGEEVKSPTDYEGVLGKSLPVLEQEWLDFVIRETRMKRRTG